MEYPIAEIFCAPQGEGMNVGQLMTFVRLAGCTVGKQFTLEEKNNFHILNNYQTKCTLADGRTFPCDTNYMLSKKYNYFDLKKEIAKVAGECKAICLTGGEPLMHNPDMLMELVENFKRDGFSINLETSGTILITTKIQKVLTWIDHVCVSPKLNFLLSYIGWSDEIKILVDKNFNPKKFPFFDALQKVDYKVYFQPINGEHTIDRENLNICLNLQKEFPRIRISMQAHKMWGTR